MDLVKIFLFDLSVTLKFYQQTEFSKTNQIKTREIFSSFWKTTTKTTVSCTLFIAIQIV